MAIRRFGDPQEIRMERHGGVRPDTRTEKTPISPSDDNHDVITWVLAFLK